GIHLARADLSRGRAPSLARRVPRDVLRLHDYSLSMVLPTVDGALRAHRRTLVRSLRETTGPHRPTQACPDPADGRCLRGRCPTCDPGCRDLANANPAASD